MTLRARLSLGFLAILAVVFAAIWLVLELTIDRLAVTLADERLDGAERGLSGLIAEDAGALAARFRSMASAPQWRALLAVRDRETLEHELAPAMTREGVDAMVLLDEEGKLAAGVGLRLDLAIFRAGDSTRAVDLHGVPYLVAALKLFLDAERTESLGVLAVAKRLGPEQERRYSALLGCQVRIMGSGGAGAAGAAGDGTNVRSRNFRVPVGDGEVAAMLAVDLSGAAAVAVWVRRWLVFVLLGAVVLGTVAALILGRALARPIERLADAAVELGQGNLRVLLPPGGRDEVGHLAQSFGQMRESMTGILGEIAGQVGRLQGAATKMGVVAYQVAARTRAETSAIGRVGHTLMMSERTVAEVGGDAQRVDEQVQVVAVGVARMDEVFAAAIAVGERVDAASEAVAQSARKLVTSARELGDTVAQLSKMVEGAERTVGGASAHVNHMAATAQRVSKEIAGAALKLAGASQTIQTSRESIGDVGRAVADVDDAFARLVGELERIDDPARRIEELSRRMKLLTLNASILAAAGADTSPYRVIAEGIRRLADETSMLAADIGGIVTGVAERRETVQKLVRAARVQSDASSTHIGDAADTVSRAADELTLAAQGLARLSDAVTETAREAERARQRMAVVVGDVRSVSETAVEQLQQGDQLLEVASDMRRHSEELNQTVPQQRRLANDIREALRELRTRSKVACRRVDIHAALTAEAVRTLESIRGIAAEAEMSASELGLVVAALGDSADRLNDHAIRFRVEDN